MIPTKEITVDGITRQGALGYGGLTMMGWEARGWGSAREVTVSASSCFGRGTVCLYLLLWVLGHGCSSPLEQQLRRYLVILLR